MFFIIGINSGQKELPFHQLVVCGVCEGYGRYQVFMTYTSLSLFFIPILKWGRRYYVTMSCCGSMYELAPEVGKRIAKGEQAEIYPADLTLVKRGRRQAWAPDSGYGDSQEDCGPAKAAGGKHVCENCGYETSEDFSYCPKCGEKLK
ncbi:MAG: zinc ribbon domain-containing protein [Hungatella sp.]|nr:zinc ribbon domain-containing protein [Hungatella sp.]